MNFDRISLILKKIGRLVDTLKEADIEVSSIEKELILTYIRELHAEVAGSKEIEPAVREPEKAEPISKAESKTDPVSEEHPEPQEGTAPENGTSLEQEEVTRPEPSAAEDQVEEEQEEPISEELEALFEIRKGTELSDKLSLSPIKDLRKSMGVNERIFTINELFDGDQRLFDEIILQLNNMSNFEEAAGYLKEKVARPNNWEEAVKRKKAEHFIRLIYRRYL